MKIKNTHDILALVVLAVRGKPGWEFSLINDDEGLRLVITDMECVDAYNPERPFPLRHYFPVPNATYNTASWRRWVHICCMGVETHEVGEWLRWGDERPFAPLHGPGEDPYVIHEFRPDEDRKTTQNGSMRSSSTKLCEICGNPECDGIHGE